MSELTYVTKLIPVDLLSDAHLLAALTGCSTAQECLGDQPLAALADQTPEELKAAGVPSGVARRLACAIELGRRMAQRSLKPGVVLRSTQQIFDAYHPRLRHEKKEHFIVLLLTAKNRLIREVEISVGTLTASLVHPREVFLPAIRHSAAGIVLIHNHPSGDPEPSPEDLDVTRRMEAVGELVGIGLADHVVIADGCYVSFLERGLLR